MQKMHILKQIFRRRKMAEDKKTPKAPNTFERGSQVPSQNKVPPMPAVKPPVSNSSSSAGKSKK